MPTIKIEAIGGKVKIDRALYEKLLLEAVDKTTTDALSDFKRTMRTWTTKITFSQMKARKVRSNIEGAAGTDSKIYLYVTRGTRPHAIRAKRARVLSFRSGYRTKTSPRIIGSHQGGAFGAAAFAREVKHPGSKARQFEEEIAQRRQRTLENYAQAAMLKASKGRHT